MLTYFSFQLSDDVLSVDIMTFVG